MAIMRNNDWKKLIQLCKAETQNTKGDKRSARGLLQRLTLFIYENKLIRPDRRTKDSSEKRNPLLLFPLEVPDGSNTTAKETKEISQSTGDRGRDQI